MATVVQLQYLGVPRVSNIVLLSHNLILVLSSFVTEFPDVFFVSTRKNVSLLQSIVLSGYRSCSVLFAGLPAVGVRLVRQPPTLMAL